MKYCSYCGAGLDTDMRFCPKCGKPFEGGKDNPHVTPKHLKPESPTYDSVPANVPPKKKKRGGIIALVIVAVLFVAGAGLYFSGVFSKTHFSDDTAAISEASNSVVMLNCYDKDGELFATGSGFAAFDDGIIVTNFHVIEENVYRVTAQTESGASFECPTVIAYDADKDIAILKADRQTGLMLLSPGKTDELQKGEKVVAIGSPLGLINSVSTGVFSGYVNDDEIGRVLQFTAAVSHGSSGGALFNNAGEVIGITFASLSDGQNLNLAVPIEEVFWLYKNTDKSMAQSLATLYDTTVSVPEEMKKLVDSLNEEELARRAKDDPSIAIFECGNEKNTIYYKLAMKVFDYVIEYAQNGDAENLNAYYRMLDSLPALESSLEKALRESTPNINVTVILMVDEISSNVAAIIEDGKIVYDIMNGVGTIPVGITPIEKVEESQVVSNSSTETQRVILAIITGKSELPIETQNNVMIDYIKSIDADNPSATNSSYVDNSSANNGGGFPISPELKAQLNQAMDDITIHVINRQSDLPVEVQNKVLINYIRSLLK